MYPDFEKSEKILNRDSLDVESNPEESEDSQRLLDSNDASLPPKQFRSPWLVPILLIVISLQLVVIVYQRIIIYRETTSPNGLSLRRTQHRTLYEPSKYTSSNDTEADDAWNSILAGHGVLAISADYASKQHLPESLKFPSDPGKRVYTIEAYHSIHCVSVLRRHYMDLDRGISGNWSRSHDAHCFDALRQYVMCNIDDTLMWTSGHRDTGHGQKKKCHDWDALRDWAEERTASYFDAGPGLGIKHLKNYHEGDGLPFGSLT